jgi:L-amino acid N-acyltransferase YncA
MPNIRDARPADVSRISEIYNHYVAHTDITFEEEPVSAAEMAQRVEDVQAQYCWLVYPDDDDVVAGYAYAGKWKSRSGYRFSVETSVYVDHQRHGRGIGKRLYAALLQRLREAGAHAVIGGVSGENPASAGLHLAFGFAEVARLREVGYKFGRWVDVTYYELLL